MWAKLWFGAGRQTIEDGVRNAEVRNALRADPMTEQASRADKAPLTEDQAGEIAEFLARVYTHQQC